MELERFELAAAAASLMVTVSPVVAAVVAAAVDAVVAAAIDALLLAAVVDSVDEEIALISTLPETPTTQPVGSISVKSLTPIS